MYLCDCGSVVVQVHGDGLQRRGVGDGALVEFPSVVDALQCAVEIQVALRATADDLTDGPRMQLRIGVNLGDIIVEESDIFGDGVNIAARLEGLAEPGGICVSDSVKTAVTGAKD